MTDSTATGVQFGRKWSLVVASQQIGLDLSQLRVTFKIVAADVETPNTAIIRVHNVSTQTAKSIQKEYSRVILQAGYENAQYGVIFDGSIKQVRVGRILNPRTDTYVDILAASGDLAYNFSLVNQSLPAGSDTDQVYAALLKSFQSQEPVEQGYTPDMTGGTLPRGKVLYGLAKEPMRDLATTRGWSWSFQNGQIQVIDQTGYAPGEAVVLTSATGMIGLPEQTDQGVKIRTLLNPLIQCGTRVQINNASVQRQLHELNRPTAELTSAEYDQLLRLATVTADGFYRVLVAEHNGDTRGNDWYSELICLALNPDVPVDQSVPAGGGKADASGFSNTNASQ